MGVCFSCRSSSSSSTLSNNVRVVHLNGLVEDFQHPVTVSQVTCKAANHVLCSPAQLLSIGVKPLPPTAQLEPGRIYLLLPHSTFLSHDVSPLDLASIVKKLTAAAKSSTPSSGNTKALDQQKQQDRLSHSVKRSWKPVLDPIRERSLNRMSESDLQEHNHLEADLRQNLGMSMHAKDV